MVLMLNSFFSTFNVQDYVPDDFDIEQNDAPEVEDAFYVDRRLRLGRQYS